MASLIVRNATLIDGTGADPVHDAEIVVDGHRITSVSADGGKNAGTVVDATGLWVVPGLIDCHVHLALTGPGSLELYLAMGVTTVRDLGDPLDFLQEQRRLQDHGAVGARMLYTGPMIDGHDPTWPALPRTTMGPDDAAQAVEEHLAAGADAIKLYTTLEPESLRRAIQQVNSRVPVAGHLGRTLASEAMEAGINSLEHVLLTPYNDIASEDHRTAPGEVMMTPGFWPKVNQGWLAADLHADHVKRWIDLLVRHDVALCPTLTVLPGADAPDEEAFDHLPNYRKMREERMAQVGRQPSAQAAELRERLRPVREKLQEFIGQIHEAGGRVISGTDTGAVGVVPGFSLHSELGFLSGAGLSNMDVIRSATASAAEAVWREDLGTVEEGKTADFLLLRHNPLEDLRALRDIQHIVQNGVIYHPQDLKDKARNATGEIPGRLV